MTDQTLWGTGFPKLFNMVLDDYVLFPKYCSHGNALRPIFFLPFTIKIMTFFPKSQIIVFPDHLFNVYAS